jgi:hypothetical protein
MGTTDDNQRGSEPAEKHEETTFDWYRGTAGEIVDTGLVQLDQLPGQPGRDAWRMFYRCGEPAGPVRRLDYLPDPENWMRIDHRKDGFYDLTVGLSREASRRRRAEKKAAWERRYAEYSAESSQRESAEKQKRRSDAERELASMPACREDFLGHLRRWVKAFINYEVDKTRVRFHGFTLSAEAVPEILEAFAAVQEAIERADVVLDRTLHKEIIARRRHEIASLDENFQRHLSLVATTGKPCKRGGDVAPAADLHMVWSAPQSAAGGGGGET